MTPNTWAVVPTAGPLSSIDPNVGATDITPVGADYVARSMTLGLFAYSGACYDQGGDVLWLPLQGGHTDYGGNEPYKLNLNTETPQWVMVRPPTGSNPPNGSSYTPPIEPGITRDNFEESGVYFDGRPRSIHSYNRVVYVPGDGPWVAVHGATFYDVSGGKTWPLRIDPTTGEATFGNVMASPPAITRFSPAGSCYDSVRHALWVRENGTGSMHKYDIATQSWAVVGSTLAAANAIALAHHAAQDLIVMIDGGSAVNPNFDATVRVFDPSDGSYTTVTVTGSSAGVGPRGSAQHWWVESLGLFAWWDATSGDDTTVISTLTPPAGDWKTGTWTLGNLPVAGSNAVTPTSKGEWGTFGRFAYSPNLDGFVLLNSTTGSLYFYALG